MGAFELTDLIGQDVNEAVTRSVWDSFFHDPKFTPSWHSAGSWSPAAWAARQGHGWFRTERATSAPNRTPPRRPTHRITSPCAATSDRPNRWWS